MLLLSQYNVAVGGGLQGAGGDWRSALTVTIVLVAALFVALLVIGSIAEREK
jgi:hypothetical protein